MTTLARCKCKGSTQLNALSLLLLCCFLPRPCLGTRYILAYLCNDSKCHLPFPQTRIMLRTGMTCWEPILYHFSLSPALVCCYTALLWFSCCLMFISLSSLLCLPHSAQKVSGPVNGDECYFWRTTGCQFGSKCRWRHNPESKGIDKKPWQRVK